MRFCLVGVIVATALWAGAANANPVFSAGPASEYITVPASEDSDEPTSADALAIVPIKAPVAPAVATPTAMPKPAATAVISVTTIATPTATTAATTTTSVPFAKAIPFATAATTTTATGTATPTAKAVATATLSAKAVATGTAILKDETPPVYNYVLLQGLNKVTGHVSKLEGPVGTVMNFGGLEIIVRRCWKSPPEEQPENAALMEIRELKPEEGPKNIFLGWMFSSSPGLSGLEHPVYDVTLLSCEFLEDPEKGDKQDVATETAEKGKKPVAATATVKPHIAATTTTKPHVVATATAKKSAATRTMKQINYAEPD